MRKMLSTLPVEQAASRLLGCELELVIDGRMIRVRIVETEAYHQTDAASHSYNGRTPRNDVMFGPAGYLYVYFTYGMHYCCNVVTGSLDEGSAVLIRAVEPLTGRSLLEKRRLKTGVEITNGPAKLCQALGIDATLNGHNLEHESLRLIIKPALNSEMVEQSRRIGITKAADVPWRFYIRSNPYVSKQ